MSAEERVRDFQRKLYRKAKQDTIFKFYCLYDKVRLNYFLAEAYKRVKANRGTPGVDGITFEQIEKEGLDSFLLSIQEDLKEKSYRPQPVKRVNIPKADGTIRPLGIPTIRDRVVQMSCKMVIEPIFEADFEDSSYGFRPKRSAADAVRIIKSKLKEGKTQVLDADLSKYFDSISHSKLLILISQRVSDKNIIHLIKLWLKCPIIENGKISGGKKNKLGTPQGGVISPLLANIYLNLVDRLVRKLDVFKGVDIIRYADDFVLMSKNISNGVLDMLQYILNRMELTMNSKKTRLIQVVNEPFNFLGFTFHYRKSLYRKDKKYLSIRPSKKAFQSIVSNIRESLVRCRNQSEYLTVKTLNPKLKGWLNYFTINEVSYTGITRRKLKIYLRDKLFRQQKRKSQRYRYAHCRGTYWRWINMYNFIDVQTYGRVDTVNA